MLARLLQVVLPTASLRPGSAQFVEIVFVSPGLAKRTRVVLPTAAQLAAMARVLQLNLVLRALRTAVLAVLAVTANATWLPSLALLVLKTAVLASLCVETKLASRAKTRSPARLTVERATTTELAR